MQQKVITAPPGTQGYILVRAIKTDASGNITYSDYTSLPYTVPGTSASGGNILTLNTNGDVQLSGGSIYAGSFPAGAGTLDVVTGTTTGTGVVLNQTGLASFASGVREFYIQASTGKAYFAGTISTSYTDLTGTHTLEIGQDAGGSGKSGIYIDPNNYWYSDGTWSAKGSDIAGALVGSKILKPSSVSSLTSSWNSSTSLTISWVFDTTSIVTGVSSNLNTKDFILTLTAGSTTKTVIVQANKSSSAQSYTLTPTLNQSLFGVVQTVFGITVAAEDTFGNIGPVSPTSGTLAGATYYSPLSAPTSLTITPVNNGYTVSYTSPTDPSFAYIEIAESTSSSSGPFNTMYTGKLNPTTIITSSLSSRWVEARFVDVLGVATSWYVYGSSIQPVSPTTISVSAPLPVTVNSAGFTNSGPFISITNATGTTTITYTTGTTAHNFVNGDKVVISGITGGTGFNTSGIVSNVTTYTFQLASQSASGTPTSYTGAVVQYTGTGEDVSITITAYNKSITAASGTSTITYTTGTTAHGFVNGDEVVISGITGGTGFNTSGIISGVTTYTFQLTAQSASGTPTSYTGAVVQYANVKYIAKLTSGTHNGYFYLAPDGTSNVSQTFTILKRDMYNQFGAYYYTFSGSFITTGSNGINNAGAGITSFSRTATVTGTTPVLSTYAVADGYTATYDFSATNATYGELYQKHSSWGTITIPIDYLTGTYVSNTTNQLVLSGVTDVDGNVITTAGDINGAFPTGYQIFGTNVPINTYVTAVSYTAPNFTLTLNNSLSATGSGIYKINALVYQGTTPANITNNLYDQFYVIVRYYDDFGFASSMSNISPVTPNNASSISNFTNAINIGGTAGSVYVGAALKSAIISTVSGSGALMTYTTLSAHGLSSTDTVAVSGVIVGGTTVNNYNVPNQPITVTGTTTFTISGTQTGAGGGGVVANNGARVFMASSLNTNNTSGYAGVFAFDSTGAVATTSLIANTGSGGYTFKTVNANIADWVIDSTHIQNTLGTASNYVGLSATGPYSIWAGSPSSGNSTNNASFSVTPTGNVQAKNISIIGSGSITGVSVNATATIATYTTASAHNLVPGQYINMSGFATTGYNFTSTSVAIASTPTPTTFTVSGTFTVGTGTGGTVIPILMSAGGLFNVTGTGIVTATGASITGAITAQSGAITGNLSLGGSLYSNTIKTAAISAVTPNATTGALYTAAGHTFVAGDVVSISGVAPYQYAGIWTVSSVVAGTSFTVLGNLNTTAVTTATGSAISSGVQSFIINKSGLVFNSPTVQGVTTIDGNTGLFTTASANIGNWLVDSSTISKTANSGKLILNSGTYSATVAAVAGAGTITFTTTSPHGFSTGQLVTLAGFGASTTTYNNATAVALTVTGPTTFTAANTGTGTPASYGVATVTDTPSIYTINSGGTYSAGIGGANNSSDKVFWAGASKTSPNFYVQADGTLFANSATISGNVTANAIVANTSISTATFSLTGTSGDLWSSTGAFQFGGASGIKYSGSGNITIGSSGNPVTINTSTGAVTISGTITANALASGTITNAGTITGGTIQSIGSGNQIVMTNGTLQFTDTTGTSVGSIQANATGAIRFWADSGATLPSMTIYNSTGVVANTTIMHQPLALWADDATLSTSAGSKHASRNILIRSSAATTTAGYAGTGGTGTDAVYNGDIWVQYV